MARALTMPERAERALAGRKNAVSAVRSPAFSLADGGFLIQLMKSTLGDGHFNPEYKSVKYAG